MYNDYVFVVPSYRRAKAFANKTLMTLKRNGIQSKNIFCFLSDPTEESDYRNECDKVGFFPGIIPSVKTLSANRNFIVNYFPEGQKLVWCDDDLDRIQFRKDEKTLVECLNFGEHIEAAFGVCEKEQAFLWGVFAAANPFFMSDKIASGLYYIIGSCYGTINRHEDVAYVSLEDKEDFERTLKYYVNDGKIVRLNYLTVKSAYYTEKGGMQEDRTAERIDTSAKFLAEKYPDLCSWYVRKTTGHTELRLRDKTPDLPKKDLLSKFFF